MVVELQGSLALTGKGHATPKAVVLGLFGLDPETLDPDHADATSRESPPRSASKLLGVQEIAFDPERDIVFAYDMMPELHPNGMKLTAFDEGGAAAVRANLLFHRRRLHRHRKQLRTPAPKDLITTGRKVPFPFGSAAELLEHCAPRGQVDRRRSSTPTKTPCVRAPRPMRASIASRQVMNACIERGLQARRHAAWRAAR